MQVITFGTVLALSLITAVVQTQYCGQRQSVARKLIYNGYKAQAGAWPWHGTMFDRKSGEQQAYTCGVTILTKQFVITAAHCTIDPQERQLIPANRVYVRVGVTNLDSPEWHNQQHDVDTIFRQYEYDDETFENDIALMKLYTNITYNNYVQPICVWQGDTSLRKVVSRVGYIVGWRHNEEYGLPKDLNVATMTIVSRKECVDSDPLLYRYVYFESKTFCASQNGTTLGPADIGSGLFLWVKRSWVLRGIVSNGKINPKTLEIDPESFVIFTDVSFYDSWIKDVISRTKFNTIPEPDTEVTVPEPDTAVTEDSVSLNDTHIPAFVSVKVQEEYTVAQNCGQKKHVSKKLIFDGYKAQVGDWPWHGAMFHRFKRGKTAYACGVTILAEQLVITVAHCTYDDEERQRLPAERAYVKVGLTNLRAPEQYVQQHDVIKIFRHEEYVEEVFENDIALLKLYTEITFTNFVQPICLWQGDTNLKHVVSETGYTVGWGYNEEYDRPNDLIEATMPIVSRKVCIDSDPRYFRKYYIEPRTFCAGYRNGTTAAPGDSGNGLYLRQGNSWVLRGMISITKSDPDTSQVDPNSYVIFVDVPYYLEWIKAYLPSA